MKQARKEREMGKHDMKEAVRFSWEPMPDEYYKEKIKALYAENNKLKEELENTQYNLAIMTNFYEQGAETIQKNGARSDKIIERKNEEIEMAKEAIYLAAMREVALRK